MQEVGQQRGAAVSFTSNKSSFVPRVHLICCIWIKRRSLLHRLTIKWSELTSCCSDSSSEKGWLLLKSWINWVCLVLSHLDLYRARPVEWRNHLNEAVIHKYKKQNLLWSVWPKLLQKVPKKLSNGLFWSGSTRLGFRLSTDWSNLLPAQFLEPTGPRIHTSRVVRRLQVTDCPECLLRKKHPPFQSFSTAAFIYFLKRQCVTRHWYREEVHFTVLVGWRQNSDEAWPNELDSRGPTSKGNVVSTRPQHFSKTRQRTVSALGLFYWW